MKRFLLSENVKILNLIGKENKSYAEVARMYGKNEASICEIVKNEKEIHAIAKVYHGYVQNIVFTNISGFRHPLGGLESIRHG